MNTYFERPKQVMFADPDNPGEWLCGIAYGHEIICACCGGIFSIDDVVEMANEDGVKCAIYEYDNWVDIADDIVGGELPEGLEYGDDGIVEVDEDFYEEGNATDVEATEYEGYYYANLE